MARTDLEQLVVSLSGDVRGFQKAMDAAQRRANTAATGIEGRFKKMNRSLSSSFSGLGKGFLTGLLSTASVTAITRAVSETVKSVANLADEAERAGVSFESLQSLGFAARQNGVEVDKLTDALKKLNLEVGEAQTKGNDLGKIFAANKLTFSTDPAENFRKVAELIRNARTEQEKAVIGAAAFGKSYGDLIPLLNLGEAGILRMEQAARDMGAVMSNDIGKAAQEFDDKLTAIADVLQTRVKAGTIAVLRDMRDIVVATGEFLDKLTSSGAAAEALANTLRSNLLTGPSTLLLERYFSGETPAPLIGPAMNANEQALVDLTQRRLALEKEINKVREANMAGSPMFERMEAELAAIVTRIEELQRLIDLQRGPAFEQGGRGAPPSPATIIPDLGGTGGDLEGAIKRLEVVIDKFARDVVAAESGGRANAKNPLSTATGTGQFIESTWLRLFKEHFPDRAKGISDAAILSLRTESQTSFELIKAYARENAVVLQAAGASVTEANLQLSHFLGPQGALKVLQAAPGTPIAGLLDPKAIAANPSILGGGATVDSVIRYAEARARATEADKAGKLAYDELQETHRQGIAEQQLENSLFGQTTLAAEQARIEFQLLAEAKRALGRELFPDEVAKIKATALEMAKLKVESTELAAAQDRAADAARKFLQAQEEAAQQASEMAQQFESAFAGAFKGFISDLIHGESLTDALTNALQRLADQLLDIVLNNLFSGLLSGALSGGAAGGGGGLLSSLFHQGARSAGTGGPRRRVAPAAFLAAQRYHSGGFAGFKPGEIPAILKRGEAVGPAAVEAAARRLIAIGGDRGIGQRVGGIPEVNLTTKIVNSFDSGSFLSEALSTAAGEKAILNFVKNRPAMFRSAIQA